MFKLFAKKKQENKKVEKYEYFIEKIKYLRSSIENSIKILNLDTTTKFKRGQLDTYCNIYTYLNKIIEDLEKEI
ncbi:MAG: hypothetical protein J6A89_04045 [Clostridia bacterium]|nr:hypothetical protein [Clostridia bacterium]